MTPERWQQVKQIFQSAIERPPAERDGFISEACANDPALRSEVESLISSHDQAGHSIQAMAAEAATEMLADHSKGTIVGKQIGHYQVRNLIGSGGMGEVFLALDTSLRRKVALKLLRSEFTRNEDRLRRFELEARAASALNHPNILTIHEIGQVGSLHFMATEYVEGETLRQRTARARLTLGEALDIGVQVASALAAAHQAGIIHRDIKPDNIMVRTDGYVKVLDFGLAKLTEATTVDTSAPTRHKVETEPGVVMGTYSYMSPEQARGLAVDARTDIWSLGVVIYEMVTGRAPFEGETSSDVIVSILDREPPPMAQFSSEVPLESQRIVHEALRKDKEERYQEIKHMLIDLKSLKQDVDLEAGRGYSRRSDLSERGVGTRSEVAPARHARPWWRANSLILLVAGSALAISTLAWLYFPRPSTNPMMPPMKTISFTSSPGRKEWPAFSPDGKQLAFSWNGEKEDNFDIYVKPIDAGAPLRLTNHPGVDSSPTWSPDGRYIAFTRYYKEESGIFTVPALGGPERKLLALSNLILSYPVTSLIVVWSPDGKYLAFIDKSWLEESTSISLLSIEDRERRRLTSPPAQYLGDWRPAFSPDGQTLAFIRWSSEDVGDIYLVPIQGGEPRRLTFDNTWINDLAWTADGQSIVFASPRSGGHRLWKVSASGGTPEPLPLGGDNPLPSDMQFSISRKGHRLAYSILLDNPDIWRIEMPSKGRRTSSMPLISSSQIEFGPQFSPDGQKVVFQSERSGSMQIWVCTRDGSNAIQLTSMSGPLAGTPRWSPDGRQIAFDARVGGNSDIYVINAEGGQPRQLTTETSNDVVPSWSRDGRWIYFCSNRSGTQQVWKVPADGGEAVQVTKGGGFAAFESPDSKFLYYCKFDVAGLWRIPVSGGEESLVLDQPKQGYWGYWAVVDRGIYFIDPETKPHATIKFFSFATHRVTQIAAIEKELWQWVPGLAVSPDGRSVLYAQVDRRGSDIMLVENF